MRGMRARAAIAGVGLAASALLLAPSGASARNNDVFTDGQIDDMRRQCEAHGGEVILNWFVGIFICELPDGNEVWCLRGDVAPYIGEWSCIVLRPEEHPAPAPVLTAPASTSSGSIAEARPPASPTSPVTAGLG